MKKLSSILTFLGIVSAFLLTSCSNSTPSDNVDEDKEIVLKFWNGFTGADGNSMKEIVNSFNKEYTGKIKIEVDTINWDSLFLKLIQNKGKPKFSPHIVAMGANRLGQMQSKGIIREINDIESYLEVSKTDYLNAAWDAGMFDGKRYSFPLDMHPTAMYYNKDLISESELPSTWEEFETVCKAKTKDGVYGWAIPNMYSITKDIVYSMALQNGSDLLNSTNAPTFNDSTWVNALTKIYNWKYNDKISPESVGASGDLTLFNTGKSVFYFDGPWTINTMKDISPVDFGVAPMPGSVGNNATSFAGSHQFTLVDCTTKDEKIKEACYTFINYVNRNPLEWAKAGQVTSYLPVHETKEYKELVELQPFTEEASTAKIGNVTYEYFYEAYNYMGSAVANCLNNQGDATSCLNEKVNLFNKFLKEQ